MKIEIYGEDAFQTSKWEGGTTTELYIYPPNSSYSERDFDLRISKAKIEVEESVFTSLPGYDRKLLVLQGNMEINHDGYHSGTMAKFDVDNFQGDWTTRSKGLCSDFNVMTNSKWKSHLFGLSLRESEVVMVPFGALNGKLFVYALSGRVSVETDQGDFNVSEGMFLKIDFQRMHELQLRAALASELVVTILEEN